MKNRKFNLSVFLTLTLVIILAITSCGDNIQENEEKDINEIALSFINDLLDGNYDYAYENYSFTDEMNKAIDSAFLDQFMTQVKQLAGDFVAIEDTQESKHETYDIINIICEFEKKYMSLNVVFDQQKKIAGINSAEAQGYDKSDKTPEAKIPDAIEEQEVVIGEGQWALPGTLTLPKEGEPFSAVVLVHGSGPQDRDQTIGPNKPFRDIAWNLASKGIAVLRYEKRTKQHVDKMNFEEATVKEETVDDALSAVELLKTHNSVDKDKIYVLGHSLGGYLIPRIGIEDDEIAGFIIMAGLTRPLEDVIVEQIEYISSLDGKVTDTEQENIDNLKTARDMIKELDINQSSNLNLMGMPAKYLLDLKDYRPTEMAKSLNRPILVLHGERDYQVTMEDFNNWEQALSSEDNTTLKSFTNLNHLFMAGEGISTPDEYFLKNNVSQEVIDFISNWIANL